MRQTIGEFEEIVLLIVAGQHDQAYGLSVTQAIEELKSQLEWGEKIIANAERPSKAAE